MVSPLLAPELEFSLRSPCVLGIVFICIPSPGEKVRSVFIFRVVQRPHTPTLPSPVLRCLFCLLVLDFIVAVLFLCVDLAVLTLVV